MTVPRQTKWTPLSEQANMPSADICEIWGSTWLGSFPGLGWLNSPKSAIHEYNKNPKSAIHLMQHHRKVPPCYPNITCKPETTTTCAMLTSKSQKSLNQHCVFSGNNGMHSLFEALSRPARIKL
jgi:hypothetical protein